jgi:lysophospholipase L1-like esterase
VSQAQPSRTRFHRYVAIGDSQTEGLHDYGDDGLPRGWADRFAERLAASHPEMLYANLAVRGKRTFEVRREQLEAALALDPDLATVVSGVNDVVRPGADIDAVAREIESMYSALASAGCSVMGCTFPLPATGLTRRVAPRLQSLNAAIRSAAERHDVLLVEMEDIPMAADLRLWSADRIHLNPDGHDRLAAAFEAALVGVSDGKWMEPLPPAPEPSRPEQWAREGAWVARFVVPKIARMLRGRSSGDGRSAKRPQLTRVSNP